MANNILHTALPKNNQAEHIQTKTINKIDLQIRYFRSRS